MADAEGVERRVRMPDLERRLEDYVRRQEEYIKQDAMRWGELQKSIAERRELDDKRHTENAEKMDCIAMEARRFVRAYEETLRDLKESNAAWASVRKAAVEKGVTGVVWALIVFAGMASWAFIKTHIT